MNGSKRLYRMSLAGLVSAAIGLSAFLTTPEALADVPNYHLVALKAPTDIRSVFISGRGHSKWRSVTAENEEKSGNVGDQFNPTGMDVCYTFVTPKDNENTIEINNTGDWHTAADQRLYSYVNQAEGKQGPGPGTQSSNPGWLNGTELQISTYTSPDCTTGQVKQTTWPVREDDIDTLRVDLTM